MRISIFELNIPKQVAPSFHYKDKVRITRGFYKGQTGVVMARQIEKPWFRRPETYYFVVYGKDAPAAVLHENCLELVSEVDEIQLGGEK